MLLALRREGIAGVCGVRGDILSPGDDEVDRDVPATIGGTLDNCRLEELEDRWPTMDDDIESDRTAFESLRRENLDKAAVVRRVEASAAVESDGARKLFRSFF